MPAGGDGRVTGLAIAAFRRHFIAFGLISGRKSWS